MIEFAPFSVGYLFAIVYYIHDCGLFPLRSFSSTLNQFNAHRNSTFDQLCIEYSLSRRLFVQWVSDAFKHFSSSLTLNVVTILKGAEKTETSALFPWIFIHRSNQYMLSLNVLRPVANRSIFIWIPAVWCHWNLWLNRDNKCTESTPCRFYIAEFQTLYWIQRRSILTSQQQEGVSTPERNKSRKLNLPEF